MESKYIFILSCLFITSCSVVIPTLIPFHDIPEPTGSFSIGTRVFNWEDGKREEWFTEEAGDLRTIIVQIWYPADTVFGNPEPYLDYPQQRVGPISEQIELPPFLIRHIQNVQTNSYANSSLKPSDKLYPLVIFSHGLGGMRMQNTVQMEELASHGFVVLALDHPYDANITIFNDGTTADYRSGAEGELTPKEFWDLRIPQINTRSADVSYVLDHIEDLRNEGDVFWKSIDLDHIGVMGHSFGGATAIVASTKDTRLDACIVLDAWLVPVESSIIQSGMKTPFLYMGRPQWDTELNYLKLDSLISASNAPSEKLILPETKHFDYSDTPQFSPMARKIGVTGTMPADAIRDTLNTRIVHFFTTHLGQD